MKTRIVSLLAALLLFAVLAAPAMADDAKARGLINSLGCKGCHTFEGSGGSIGPALDGAGKHLSEDQIREKLLEPKKSNPKSMMPAYGHLAKEDVDALTDFLAAQK